MKQFCFAALAAAATLGAAAFEKTVTEGAPAPVKLKCERPGAWTLDAVPVAETEKGVFELEIRLSAPRPETPPAFSVWCELPQKDVPYVWRAGSMSCGIPPVWGGLFRSQLGINLPVYAYFRADGRNAMTLATSESKRDVGFRCGVVEEGSKLRITFTYFDFREAPISNYAVRVRMDGRAVAYSDAVRAASDWIAATAQLQVADVPDAAFEPLYSTWYNFHQDVHAADIEAECEIAAKLGMKTVIVDDGWQTDDNRRGYAFCGDWQVSTNRFPDMAAHVARVHALGMRYMMWYSVPFVGHNAANFGRFRGKYLKDIPGLGASVLDPRFPDVREFLIGIYEKALRDWNLDGFKLDFIDSFDGGDEARPGDGRDIATVPEAVDVLMKAVYARLKALKPDVLVEFRQRYVGPAIRQYGNMLRVGDCPGDYQQNRAGIARLRLTSGTTAVHADMLEWHVSESPEEAARHVLSSLFGTVQYSLMLRTLPESHLRMLRHWIGFSVAHREALQKGTFAPLRPELNYPVLVGASADERIVGVYASDLCAHVPADGRTTYVLNATPADGLLLDFAAAPKTVEAYDTFGVRVGTLRPGAGLSRVRCPRSGYLKVVW